ncbi:hypothetical protein LV457_05755 [Mycobacterium sp. MYCO198283]|uniref:hypothetical protein n=1 Tax=Mycobacterium sp. MYCO198283 TaxID=2883505 RepID=UPI001E5427D4|nr:hypothetical protein [Mycobacterium sp. MYCO198283]MCG5431796.1 hypothetical protein [Mycobacterium sp. MYCO198283]
MSSNYTTPACSGHAAPKSSPRHTVKRRAASTPEPAATTGAARRAWHQPVQLAFEQWRDDANQWRARGGGRYVYRITRTGDREYHAAQKGGSAFTPVGGVCTTRAQAEDLAQRYENGAPQLSHRQYRDLPYREAVAKLEE